MGNGRGLQGPSANAVPSSRKTKKNHRREMLQGAAWPLAPCPDCYVSCVLHGWLAATCKLQQFREARFVNGCIVKFSRWTCRK